MMIQFNNYDPVHIYLYSNVYDLYNFYVGFSWRSRARVCVCVIYLSILKILNSYEIVSVKANQRVRVTLWTLRLFQNPSIVLSDLPENDSVIQKETVRSHA